MRSRYNSVLESSYAAPPLASSRPRLVPPRRVALAAPRRVALAAPLLGLGLDAEVPLTSMGIAGAVYVVLASVLMAYACRQERNRR